MIHRWVYTVTVIGLTTGHPHGLADKTVTGGAVVPSSTRGVTCVHP